MSARHAGSRIHQIREAFEAENATLRAEVAALRREQEELRQDHRLVLAMDAGY